MDDFSLDQLEALRALAAEGTTARAATRLRVTQSAVSKRIATLEARVGAALVEPDGRRVALTPAARRLLEGASPLLVELRAVVAEARALPSRCVLRVGASESLLASWLPRALRQASHAAGVELEVHAHRGPALVERVRSGEHALAVCAGTPGGRDLVVRRVAREAMVVVGAGRAGRGQLLRVATIEERSLTWQEIAAPLAEQGRVEVIARMESFGALVQCARSGLGAALVPCGIALALGVRASRLRAVPGVTRSICLVHRPTLLRRPGASDLLDALAAALGKGV